VNPAPHRPRPQSALGEAGPAADCCDRPSLAHEKSARWKAKPAILRSRIECGRNRENRHATADHHDRERAEFAALQPGSQGRTARVGIGHRRDSTGTGSLAGDTIREQTRQALANCEAILRAAGATLDDVIEAGILLTNPEDFNGLNEEYAGWFPSEPPTRYVAKLGVELPGLLVSIRMTAFVT
jgi:enamine deaminase RidA (YjgF/YER057c/UK114 family)